MPNKSRKTMVNPDLSKRPYQLSIPETFEHTVDRMDQEA
jgi:hypothetical protein